ARVRGPTSRLDSWNRPPGRDRGRVNGMAFSRKDQVIPTSLMMTAARPAPMSGPKIGTRAYPQSEPPLSLIGRTACATRGPKSLAGLIAYPVGPPRLNPMTHTSTPQNHGLNPGAKPAGASSLLPKLKPTTIRQTVTIISHNRFA